MSWLDRLVPASLEEIPFYTEDVSRESGRRQTVIKYPGRAQVNVQDLGADSDEFAVNAYLIGPDYDVDRDLFEAKLNEPGPKRITLPRRGSRDVTIIGKPRTTENHKQGGYAKISFRCIVYVPEARFQRPDRQAQTTTAADAVKTASASDFGDKWNTAGLPAAYQTFTDDALNTAHLAMGTADDRISTALGIASEANAVVTAFGDDFAGLTGSADDLVASMQAGVAGVLATGPNALATLKTAGASAFQLAQIADATVAGARLLFAFADDFIDVPGTSANAVQQQTNRQAIVDSVRATTCGEMARALAQLPIGSRNQAAALRADVLDLIDTAAATAPDGLFTTLQDLLAATVAYLDETARTLPEIATYTTPATTSAAELAHQLYGDGSRADEIAERNGLAYSVIIPANTALEILVS